MKPPSSSFSGSKKCGNGGLRGCKLLVRQEVILCVLLGLLGLDLLDLVGGDHDGVGGEVAEPLRSSLCA